MREILFRGKRVDNGEWVEGYLISRRPTVVESASDLKPWYIEVPQRGPDDHGGTYGVLPYTIGQYIGMKDIHGRKIYEGDIVREYHYNSSYGLQIIAGLIYWADHCLRYMRTCSLSEYITVEINSNSILEVIGNKYDGAVFFDGEECLDLLKGESEESENE